MQFSPSNKFLQFALLLAIFVSGCSSKDEYHNSRTVEYTKKIYVPGERGYVDEGVENNWQDSKDIDPQYPQHKERFIDTHTPSNNERDDKKDILKEKREAFQQDFTPKNKHERILMESTGVVEDSRASDNLEIAELNEEIKAEELKRKSKQASEQPKEQKPQNLVAERMQQGSKVEIVVPDQNFSLPLNGKILKPFSPASGQGGAAAGGIEIEAVYGTTIKAINDGTVVYAGNEIAGHGNIVIIKHQGGWTSVYGNLDGLLFTKNDVVKKGQILGQVDDKGFMYFALRKDGKPLDPAKIFPALGK